MIFIGFVAKNCSVCGKIYNGYKPLSHVMLKDCDKKSINKYNKEMKKIAKLLLKDLIGNDDLFKGYKK